MGGGGGGFLFVFFFFSIIIIWSDMVGGMAPLNRLVSPILTASYGKLFVVIVRSIAVCAWWFFVGFFGFGCLLLFFFVSPILVGSPVFIML